MALRTVGRRQGPLLQIHVRPRLLQPLQELAQLLHALIPLLLQPRQRVQRLFPCAGLLQQRIQMTGNRPLIRSATVTPKVFR